MTITLTNPVDFGVFDTTTKFKIDPLACSVSLQRRQISFDLSSEEDHVIDEDLIKANQIREYYRKKYFWNSFKKSVPQSEFRNNAIQLLAITDQWDLTEKESGLFVKLPCFYEEDIVYDKFRNTLITNKDSYTFGLHSFTYTIHTLSYLKSTLRWQGKTRRISYWFKNKENKLFCFTTTVDNPLIGLFEEKIKTIQEYEFKYAINKIADMWYYDIKIFNFKKEQHA